MVLVSEESFKSRFVQLEIKSSHVLLIVFVEPSFFVFTVNLCLCNQPFICLLISYLENPRIKKENGK